VITICSSNILLSEEKAVSVIHLWPYFILFLHFSKSFVCSSLFFILHLVISEQNNRILPYLYSGDDSLLSFRYWKFLFVSWT